MFSSPGSFLCVLAVLHVLCVLNLLTSLLFRLIVHTSYKPTPAVRIVINAIKPRRSSSSRIRNIKFNFQVPFILMPRILPPPIPRSAPRPRRRHHPAAQTAKKHFRRTPFTQLDRSRHTRPENSATSHRFAQRPFAIRTRRSRASRRFFARDPVSSAKSCLIGFRHKSRHTEFSGSVRIHQLR